MRILLFTIVLCIATSVCADTPKSEPQVRLGKPSEGAWEASSSQSSVVGMLSGLALCVGVLLIGSYGYKKLHGDKIVKISKNLKIIERLPLTQKSSLCVVEWEGKKLLVGTGTDPVSFFESRESFGNFSEEICEEA